MSAMFEGYFTLVKDFEMILCISPLVYLHVQCVSRVMAKESLRKPLVGSVGSHLWKLFLALPQQNV